MPRWPHGLQVPLEHIQSVRAVLGERTEETALGFATARPVVTHDFGFLFPELQADPDNLLPVSRATRDALVALGDAMAESFVDPRLVGTPDDPIDRDPNRDSDISAAYTYFGQFVDHDITLEASSTPGSRLAAEDLQPLPLNRIREETQNVRTALLELDSVYGLSAERDLQNPSKMKLGKVTLIGDQDIPRSRPPGKDDDNDLPREGASADDVHDHAALIGDPRNDENTIISQLHVAFLRAHNELIRQGQTFGAARRILRQHYQHIVLHDFLKKIADPLIVDDIIENGNRIYDPDEDEFFMPLEFSVAAFRFGHSMVHAAYDYNLNFNRSGEPGTIPATLDLLFTLTALSGQLVAAFPTLPENWIIEWENFFDPDGGEPLSKARRIDTELVEPLEHLKSMSGQEEGGPAAKLAVRNLLRGYLLRLPTGQAVARELRRRLQGVRDIPVLGPNRIRNAAASPQQAQVLGNAGFLDRTPLWHYLLAEAADPDLGDGQRLGPVGSTIVAEVLVGLVRRSPDSILEPGLDWEPNLPSARRGTFTLPDLLRFAGVL